MLLGDQSARVKAYTTAGDRVCAAGLGSGPTLETYPAHWAVQNLLKSVPLVKFSDEEGRWIYTDFQPRAVIFSKIIGVNQDQLGWYNTTHIALPNTELTIACDAKPCAEVDGISTPQTPP